MTTTSCYNTKSLSFIILQETAKVRLVKAAIMPEIVRGCLQQAGVQVRAQNVVGARVKVRKVIVIGKDDADIAQLGKVTMATQVIVSCFSR